MVTCDFQIIPKATVRAEELRTGNYAYWGEYTP